jgi:CRISPR/Cas system-associated protein Cas10 (large subunit of type III CRISPR-Cas system)
MVKAVTDELDAGVVRFRTASASGIDEITRLVSDDEMCFSLREINKPSSKKGMHRFQELRIVRQDRLVTAYVDLGPAYMFKADPIFIPGGQVVNGRGEVWHTVAELREIAEEFRGRPVYRPFEPSDLQSAFHNMVEERKKKRKNQSTFGRLSQLVRSNG